MTQQDDIDKETLERLYCDEEMSMSKMRFELDCSTTKISKLMDKYGIEKRSISEQQVLDNRDKHNSVPLHMLNGYEVWQNGYRGELHQVAVHRLLAVAEYGFDALDGKDVHHAIPIPWLNIGDNIELMTPGEHARYHMREKYHDPEWLESQYWDRGKSMNEIADECDVAHSTILDWMDKHDIPRRTGGEAARLRSEGHTTLRMPEPPGENRRQEGHE